MINITKTGYWFAMIMAVGFIMLLGWGIVGPYLVSAASNILLILGILVFCLTPFAMYWVIMLFMDKGVFDE